MNFTSSPARKFSRMSPTIFVIFLIGFSNANVPADSLVASNSESCDCLNDSEQIDCARQSDANDTVYFSCKPSSREISILCGDNTVSKEWYKSLEGINVSGSYEQMTIRKCPVPGRPIKDLLGQTSVDKIRTLTIDLAFDPQNSYQAYHFAGLHSIKWLHFVNNNITSLPEDVFVGLPNLMQLLLNGNYLQRIPSNLFTAVPYLIFLDLAQNNLTRLEADTFKPLSSLRTLNINGNGLTNLTRELFTPLRNLTRLDVSNNGITTFDSDVFQDLSALQELNLSFNNIRALPREVLSKVKSLRIFKALYAFDKSRATIDAEMFSNMTSIQQIIMTGNNFTHLPETIFRGTTKLKFLSLNQNRLTELAPALFKTSENLKMIDLSNNRLTSLNGGVFQGLQELDELRLPGNKIAYIHENVFDDLKSLTLLDLRNNRLSHLQDGVFDHLPILRVIHLDNNRLDMSGSNGNRNSILKNCLQLQEVHLRNNSVANIFRDWQLTLTKLSLLDLSHNELKTLEVHDFQFMQSGAKTVRVILNDNNIELIDLRNYEFSVGELFCTNPPCNYGGFDLRVSLQNNPINCDCRNYDFIRLIQGRMSSSASSYMRIENKEELKCAKPEEIANLTLAKVNLKDLYCPSICPKNCSCRSRAMDEVTVINCTSVGEIPTWLPNVTNIELILAHNNLKSLEKVSALMSSRIIKLSLSYNALKHIDDLLVPPSLQVLELDHNEISVLNKAAVETLNQTNANITLHSNRWKCNCDAKYFLNFLKYRFSKSLIPEINLITCDGTNQAIIDLTEDYLCSRSLYLYIVCLTVASLGVLFGALAILYLWYEHEIKVFMFAHKICLWLVTEKEVDRDKEFDAFISYAHQDEEFVVRHLLPNLESGPHPYKLCLAYRDWLVGDLIPVQIVRSVERSRRTIIVLSQNYLESRWANLEFRTAYLQMLKERHARVLVILLEELDSEKLDPELKAYVSMNTYLKWGDSSFWDRLRYAMPHPQQHRKLKSKKKANIIDGKNHRILMEAFKLKNSEDVKSKADTIIC